MLLRTRGKARGRARAVPGGQEVLAMAYDAMIPGYATKNTNNLWL